MLPDGEGTELIAEIRQSHPETPVAVLSAREDVDEAASKAGADAAIPKDTSLPDIISSLRQLAIAQQQASGIRVQRNQEADWLKS